MKAKPSDAKKRAAKPPAPRSVRKEKRTKLKAPKMLRIPHGTQWKNVLAVNDAIGVREIPGLKGEGLIQIGQVKKLELRYHLDMSRQTFGRIVNVAERTIAKVESGESAEKLERPYNELYRLWDALCEVVDPECLGVWFQVPNESFDGLKPIELIERGEIDRIWNMVFELQTGMPG